MLFDPAQPLDVQHGQMDGWRNSGEENFVFPTAVAQPRIPIAVEQKEWCANLTSLLCTLHVFLLCVLVFTVFICNLEVLTAWRPCVDLMFFISQERRNISRDGNLHVL